VNVEIVNGTKEKSVCGIGGRPQGERMGEVIICGNRAGVVDRSVGPLEVSSSAKEAYLRAHLGFRKRENRVNTGPGGGSQGDGLKWRRKR